MAIICNHCFSTIISDKHKNECNTINMYEVIECIIKPDSKNMMTFGLGGCTAIIMVFFTKDTNIPYKIIFGHHPIKNNVLLFFSILQLVPFLYIFFGVLIYLKSFSKIKDNNLKINI